MEEMNLDGLELTQAVKTWMDRMNWTDRIEISEDRTASTVKTSMTIQEQVYKVLIETLETEQAVFVYFWSLYQVPRSRMNEMTRLLNRINFQLDLGTLACQDGLVARPVRFRCGLDVEGSALSPVQVHTLIGLGIEAFRAYGNILAATALTKRPVDEIWAESMCECDEEDPWAGVKVPRLFH
jgi:hypothetical protein